MTTLADIQRMVGTTPDGKWGPATAAAIAAKLSSATGPVQTSQAGAGDAIDAVALPHLRREEGTVLHAYQDHLGYWTIGTGRLIDKRKGGRISQAENDMLLLNDVARFRAALAGVPAWERVKNDPVRATALLSMAFQMGVEGLKGFTNTLAMVTRGDYAAAAANMLQSKWAKQTPERAQRVADMLRTGRV